MPGRETGGSIPRAPRRSSTKCIEHRVEGGAGPHGLGVVFLPRGVAVEVGSIDSRLARSGCPAEAAVVWHWIR
eukprot:11197735-Lingulodinium_polyedra.AAC.1